MTLDGLEQIIKKHCKNHHKVHFVRYADDFIITGSSKEFLEEDIKPLIASFLKERGLLLSLEKTKIIHIQKGFGFLGCNIRKYGNKLLIKPARNNVRSFLQEIKQTIKSSYSLKTEALIENLNMKIRGWANYYQHVVSKQTFQHVDSKIFWMLR